MKRLLASFLLLTALTACAKEPEPAPTPPLPPAEQTTVVPSSPESETPVEPAPEPVPEEPAPEEPQLPDLPYPIYCYADTAVDNKGTVILQVPDHTLELCFDAVTGKPAGILSSPVNISWSTLYDGFYALDGTALLTDVGMPYFQCYGDLCWYGIPGDYVVRRLSDGTILQDGLKAVQPAGDYLALQPAYWNDRCTLLDKSGTTALELDRGFSLQAVYKDGGTSYLVMASTLDGTANLVSTAGKPLLDRFYDEIISVNQGCAILRDGSTYLAVDLSTGDVRFTWDKEFILLPDGVMAITDEGWKPVDLQGNVLYDKDTDIGYPQLYDWNGDGMPEYLLATLRDDWFNTVVLGLDGTELAVIPTQVTDVQPISATTLTYTLFTAAATRHFEVHLVDLNDGTDTVLLEGTDLYVSPITTSGGHMLLCTREEGAQLFLNDGTPALIDLGQARYLGGDVFANEEGLRCLDGTWLYRQED